MSPGIVYLVGAGPGDPGLLTVRALELLRSAEVVAHDKLIPAAILALANPKAELLAVGRRRGDATQEFKLHPEVLARAQAGRRVVRLKSGDPMIFGRGAEEAQELADAGIPFEIVPGVSAALGAAAYAGIPLTDRRCSSSVTLTTGHDGAPSDCDGDGPDLTPAGQIRGTIVLYMAAHRLADNLRRLIDGGRSPSTPAAYVEQATQRDQRVIIGTLADLAGRVAADGLRGAALVIVGEVVHLRQEIGWREARPLSGRRVLVARARVGESQIAEQLRELGADVVEAPTVTLSAPSDPYALLRALERVSSYGGVMFACEAGVERTLDILRDRADLDQALRKSLVIAVGSGAIDALERGGLPPRIEARGACRNELERHASQLRLGTILAIVAENGRPSLLEDLALMRVRVDVVAAYRLAHRFDAALEIAPDLVVLPSSSAAEAVLNSPFRYLLVPVPMLAMGSKTEQAAWRQGAHTVTRSREDSVPSMIDGVLGLLGPTAGPRLRAGVVSRSVAEERVQ